MLEEKVTMPEVLKGMDDEDITNVLWMGYSKKDWSRDFSKDPDVVKFRKHIMGKTEWNTFDELKNAVMAFTSKESSDRYSENVKEEFKSKYSNQEINAIRNIMPSQINVSAVLGQEDLLDLSKIKGRYFVYTLSRAQFKNVKFSSLAMTDGKTVFNWPLAAIKNGAHTLVRKVTDFKDAPVMKTFDIKTWRFMINNPKKFMFENIFVLSPKTKVPDEAIEYDSMADPKNEFTKRFVKDF